MANKLSGWYRMFIVFAGVWTVLSIGMFLVLFLSLSHPIKPSYEREKLIEEILEFGHGKQNREEIERDKEEEEREYKRELHYYHKERKDMIYMFLLGWLPPIGLVYGLWLCVGWIIRGFRKEN
jgi:hypothetical protein